MTNKYTRWRILLVTALFTVAFLGVGARAVYLQVYRGQWLSQKAVGQIRKSVTDAGRRGTIYDANGNELAVSVEVTSIAARPPAIEAPSAAARRLAGALGMPSAELKRRLGSGRPFVWLKRQATPKEAAAVAALGLSGIEFLSETKRYYPNTTLAAQVLGFTGVDGNGLEGLEYYYDRHLRGRQAKTTVLKNALGQGIDAAPQDGDSLRGHNLVLTIDQNIQYLAETALAEAVAAREAKSGIAIVMAPDTGALLALAHAPQFNPNAFKRTDRDLWRNRAITDAYEVGSTMKIFSAAAALESGDLSADTIFYCENGAYRIGADVVHDVKKHGWLSLQQIVKYSSNIGAVKISEKIGRRKLYENLRRFGFGEKTGIDAPGEVPGLLSHYSAWSRIDTGAIAFGHGISVSAIQLVRAVAAVANGGVLMQPFLVSTITDAEGRVVFEQRPRAVGRAVSSKTAAVLRNILKTVVTEGGTGVNAALEGYSVAGKTGTARKMADDGTYDRTRHLASFVGFAPADRPAVVVLVMIDEPRGAEFHGGQVAAPVFRRIAQGALSYLNIAPQDDRRRLRVGLDAEIRG